jgi:DNA polymerase-1
MKKLSCLNNNFYVISANSYYKFFTTKDEDWPTPKFSLDIGTYILNSNSKPDSYEKIAKYYKLKTYKNIKNEQFDPNLIEILSNIDEIYAGVSKQFKSGEYLKIYNMIDAPVMPLLARMTLNGISIDKNKINKLSKIVSEDIVKIKSKIFTECSSEFNLNSPKQLSEVLYNQMDLPVLKKTPKGSPSTDASVLEQLSKNHKIAEFLLEYREIEKLRSTYIDGLSTDIVNGKIHSTFNLFGTTTGRLSSEKPNLQNIPVKTKLGRKIREFFISTEGKTFIIADYSQIELRVLAHMSSDTSMKKILDDRKKDIHTETAARIFKTNDEDITYDMRRKAKEINFGLLYGMEAFGLAKNLSVTRKEATEMINSYFVQFPNVKKYLDEIVLSSKKKGYTKTVYGRRRYISELQSENNQIYSVGKRMAMNAPIQGTAADIVKLAMIDIENALSSNFKEAKIVLQVHDEVVVECLEKDSIKVQDVVIKCMESVKGVSVPLYVNSSISLDLSNNNN